MVADSRRALVCACQIFVLREDRSSSAQPNHGHADRIRHSSGIFLPLVLGEIVQRCTSSSLGRSRARCIAGFLSEGLSKALTARASSLVWLRSMSDGAGKGGVASGSRSVVGQVCVMAPAASRMNV